MRRIIPFKGIMRHTWLVSMAKRRSPLAIQDSEVSRFFIHQPFHQIFFAGDATAATTSTSAIKVDRDYVDPGTYGVPMSMPIPLSILYQPFHQLLFTGNGRQPGWVRPFVDRPINRWIRRDEVDRAVYDVLRARQQSSSSESGSKLISFSGLYQPFHQVLS